ncbi:hypothetical protein [Caballeronia grimmiae]|uniref:hypothetical protein n=1 Tax=Caballeronia grimmiae TaxID=1071679 RepID=UPI0038B85585
MEHDHEIMRLRAMVEFAITSFESLSAMLTAAEAIRKDALSALTDPVFEVADSSASLLRKELAKCCDDLPTSEGRTLN